MLNSKYLKKQLEDSITDIFIKMSKDKKLMEACEYLYYLFESNENYDAQNEANIYVAELNIKNAYILNIYFEEKSISYYLPIIMTQNSIYPDFENIAKPTVADCIQNNVMPYCEVEKISTLYEKIILFNKTKILM